MKEAKIVTFQRADGTIVGQAAAVKTWNRVPVEFVRQLLANPDAIPQLAFDNGEVVMLFCAHDDGTVEFKLLSGADAIALEAMDTEPVRGFESQLLAAARAEIGGRSETLADADVMTG